MTLSAISPTIVSLKTEKAPGSTLSTTSTTTHSRHDLTRALSCLRRTRPALELRYPSDAEDHFESIHNALKEWTNRSRYHYTAGYGGPWIENYWIEHFGALWHKRKSATPLSSIFGPYIPLLIPWVDLWFNNRMQYPNGMMEQLKTVLRPDVPYITVSQNDQGLTPVSKSTKLKFNMSDYPNLLVLSAGGYGHVPLLLMGKVFSADRKKPVERRHFLVSYMGSITHAPRNMRLNMSIALKQKAAMLNISDKIKVGKSNNWAEVMADSKFQLVPRGFGRSSYHLGETLQMGLIPIQVYSDIPWVPFRSLFEKLGYLTTVDGLGNLLEQLSNMSNDQIEHREAQIKRVRESHILPPGQMQQISIFMTGQLGSGNLECQKLPVSIRDA